MFLRFPPGFPESGPRVASVFTAIVRLSHKAVAKNTQKMRGSQLSNACWYIAFVNTFFYIPSRKAQERTDLSPERTMSLSSSKILP